MEPKQYAIGELMLFPPEKYIRCYLVDDPIIIEALRSHEAMKALETIVANSVKVILYGARSIFEEGDGSFQTIVFENPFQKDSIQFDGTTLISAIEAAKKGTE